MDLKSYLDYVAAFNAQDWKRVITEYYAPDAQLVFPIVTLSGRDEALAWYTAAHEALYEILVPHHVSFADHALVVDLTVQFVALGPTDYLPIPEQGQAGDVVTVPMRATYGVGEDGLISSLVVEFTSPPRRDQAITG